MMPWKLVSEFAKFRKTFSVSTLVFEWVQCTFNEYPIFRSSNETSPIHWNRRWQDNSLPDSLNLPLLGQVCSTRQMVRWSHKDWLCESWHDGWWVRWYLSVGYVRQVWTGGHSGKNISHDSNMYCFLFQDSLQHMYKETIGPKLKIMEDILKKSKGDYFVGKSIHWCDVYILGILQALDEVNIFIFISNTLFYYSVRRWSCRRSPRAPCLLSQNASSPRTQGVHWCQLASHQIQGVNNGFNGVNWSIDCDLKFKTKNTMTILSNILCQIKYIFGIWEKLENRCSRAGPLGRNGGFSFCSTNGETMNFFTIGADFMFVSEGNRNK